MPEPHPQLAAWIEVWKQSADDLTALLDQLDAADWDRQTDLPGWDVRAVASHVAHLEKVLATGEEEHAEVPEAPHVKGLMGTYTEIGVVNRRETDPAQIVAEIRESVEKRYADLQADPPTDPDEVPAGIFGGMPWPWKQLLRNRPLDLWMHEQDVRRATGRPGGMDSEPARHTAEYLAESLGFVLGKKVGAAPGTTLVLEMTGSSPYGFEIGEDGRGRPVDPPADPTVRLRMDRESFIRLAGGRCDAEPGAVTIEGDLELGGQVVTAMATTP